MRKACTAMVALGPLVLTACITVNIYFPAPEVRRAAEQIVDETWGPGASAPEPTGAPRTGAAAPWWRVLAPARAWAQAAVDLNVSTAAIRKLKADMTERAEQLKPSMRAGHVGIDANGLLVVRSLDGVPLRDRATVQRLVQAENRDRLALYKEIAKANDFGDDRVDDIQRIFAATWVEKAEKGWPIEQPDGSWRTR